MKSWILCQLQRNSIVMNIGDMRNSIVMNTGDMRGMEVYGI